MWGTEKMKKSSVSEKNWKKAPKHSFLYFVCLCVCVCVRSHKLKWKMNESHQNNSLTLLPLPFPPACHPTRHPRLFHAPATSPVAVRSNLRERHLIWCRRPSYVDFLLLWVKQQTTHGAIHQLIVTASSRNGNAGVLIQNWSCGQ